MYYFQFLLINKVSLSAENLMVERPVGSLVVERPVGILVVELAVESLKVEEAALDLAEVLLRAVVVMVMLPVSQPDRLTLWYYRSMTGPVLQAIFDNRTERSLYAYDPRNVFSAQKAVKLQIKLKNSQRKTDLPNRVSKKCHNNHNNIYRNKTTKRVRSVRREENA